MIKGKNIAMIGAYPSAHIGGVAIHTYGISKELSKYNAITIITTGTKKGHWNDNGVEMYQEKLWYPYRYTTLQSMLQTTKRALLLRKKVDLYHAHGPFFSGIGFLDKQKPLVLTFHGYSSLETVSRGRIKPNSIQFKFMRWVEKKAVERADAVIAVGENLKNWITNELEANPEKVFHIPNGVDANKIDAIRNNNIKESKIVKKQLGLKNRRIILFVKAFTKQNGILTLVEALPLIIKNHKNAHLVAIGGGLLKDQVVSLSKKLKISSNVTLIDRIPNEQVPIYLNFSEVFTIPFIPLFNFEGEVAGVGDTIGIAHLEAMAAGLPVVATAIGDFKKIEAELNNALVYVPPNDPKSLAAAIIYILDHPGEAKEMGTRARKLVLEKYSWNKIVEQISRIYQYALYKAKAR